MKLTSIVPVDHLPSGQGGGKARGLAKLKKFGANIPETYVVLYNSPAEIRKFLNSLPANKPYAVRSSADGEDGTDHSYAGQFETYLNVIGKNNLLKAVSTCFDSVNSQSVTSYKKNLQTGDGTGMNVIIQEMTEPVISGVLFTADPVKQRHDLITISVTEGLGEALMSGHKGGENLSFYKHNGQLSENKLIKKEWLDRLIHKALEIEEKYGKPADMEWAIDKDGKLWWLQLRPVTNLDTVHLNELDDAPLYDKPIYTRGNIGEMMPGPVTPLTLSTFARAIEVGLQVFYRKIGALDQYSDKNLFVHSFYNHLFFDMNRLYESTRKVFLSKKENLDFLIVGSIVPGLEVNREVSLSRGVINFIKMMRYINTASKAREKLRNLHDTFRLQCPGDIKGCFRLIDDNLQTLFDAYSLHYVTSSQSGSLFATILNIYSGGKMPQRHHLEQVSGLFNSIPDIESAHVLESIDHLAKLLTEDKNLKTTFLDVSNEDSLSYLTTTGPEKVKTAWHEFINRHGHRCVREAELFEREWAVDPTPVIEGLKTKTRLMREGFNGHVNGYASGPGSLNDNDLKWIGKMIVKSILPKARKAVARREQTKAWSIGIQYQFKKAYRHLARMMVDQKMLENNGQIFFLLHREIGEMLKSGDYEYWKNIAKARQRLYPEMQELSFSDLSFGIPFPEEANAVEPSSELSGIPVSRGIVEGTVRLVNNMNDARLLQKDEIMVARFTDVGWTPFYSVISGLITEIGSPLSHGAVVAREYGLPAVVSMKGAMNNLKTGQRIKLDAVKGEVIVMD